MSACRRVIGATADGKHTVICGQPVPCPDHFPVARTTVAEARFWPAGATPARFVPVVDLPQISDADWQKMARERDPSAAHFAPRTMCICASGCGRNPLADPGVWPDCHCWCHAR